MAALLSNKGAFNGTRVDLNGNSAKITVGNSMSVTAGMYNAAYIGGKTLVIAGAATNITHGITTNFTFGNVISASYGRSWNINNSNNTSYDIITRVGVSQSVLAGGVSDTQYALRLTEDESVYGLRRAAIVSYLITVGLALVGMLYPPFEMVGKDSDGNATGVSTDNTNLWRTCLIDGSAIIIAATIASNWAQKLWNMKDFNPVSHIVFDNAGINCEVYKDPDGFQPILPPGVERPNAPPMTTTLDAKAGFYIRPFAGTESGDPLSNRRLYMPTSAMPEIELLTTAGPAGLPFSQIYMVPTAIFIGGGPMFVADVITPPVVTPVTTNPANTMTKTAATAQRLPACGPLITLNSAPLVAPLPVVTLPSITIRNDLTQQNTIVMDSLATTIKRLAGSIELAVGVLGMEATMLALDPMGVGISGGGTLATSGSISLDAVAGDTTIKGPGGIELASFTAAGVTLKSGANNMSLNATGIFVTAPMIDVN